MVEILFSLYCILGYFLLGSVTSDVSDKNILLFTVKKIRSLIIESCLSTGNVISDTFEKLKEKNEYSKECLSYKQTGRGM